MAKKRRTILETMLRRLRRKGPQTHKELVVYLLKRRGLGYDATTRKYFDNVFYGPSGLRAAGGQAYGDAKYSSPYSDIFGKW